LEVVKDPKTGPRKGYDLNAKASIATINYGRPASPKGETKNADNIERFIDC
jgi:hypothetical protein